MLLQPCKMRYMRVMQQTPPFSLQNLADLIAQRAVQAGDASYTAHLLQAGPARIAKKFGEEAVETVIAALQEDRAALISEAADTLYHLLVLLQARGITLDEVVAELGRRTRQSGLTEKASRPV
jgi:phosphoribosyl-ATP pyrophosphohydrolase